MGYRRSVIKKILANKVDKWLESIVDENVRSVAKQNCVVTGGSITSLLMGEKPNDYDIYFKTKEATLVLAQYYVKLFNDNRGKLATKALASCNPRVETKVVNNIKGEPENRVLVYIKSAGVAGENQNEYKYFESYDEVESDIFLDAAFQSIDMVTELAEDLKPKYKPVFFSQNAITLSNGIQLVIRFFGDPTVIHRNFDFVHATCWYDRNSDYLELPKEALEAILSKSLIYMGSLYPVASIFRTRKFIARGWRITAGQLLKIIYQLQSVDLNNIEVLQEQLMGVDAAYMHQLIQRLQNDGQRIDEAYLAKLIDEIFEE